MHLLFVVNPNALTLCMNYISATEEQSIQMQVLDGGLRQAYAPVTKDMHRWNKHCFTWDLSLEFKVSNVEYIFKLNLHSEQDVVPETVF